jgi:hypothetical protein
MILDKLKEALVAAEAQYAADGEVVSQLRAMISKYTGSPIPADPGGIKFVRASALTERDKLDDIAEILRAEGKPMHISAIAERLSALKGETISRTQIEPGVNRHISKVKARRIDKFGPSIYGLPEWKDMKVQATLTDVA